ncbi:peptidase domain-containing ABC transporter [Pricia sp. S334]|uniref:Peptidase domain-containing ABC transporter n=1 Tax=Pricia mediterranea TaxID=3076079 RepID=A0ABU3L521_9FLAO|nr:peptidase domain-containing ABC transporter [Pricia sp. S334]MDT7828353.1 peptidase domain-containing ABC transporter [Pricia sp. S334]
MFRQRYPLQRQFDASDCGASSLSMVMMQHGVYRDMAEIRERVGQTKNGVSILELEKAAESYHINTLPVSITFDDLKEKAPFPLIAHWRQEHFVVVNRVGSRHVHISDPASGNSRLSHERFIKGWMTGASTGTAILFEPTMDFYSLDSNGPAKGNLGILWNYIAPYRAHVRQLLIGLLMVALINIAMPFLTQRLVDYGVLAKDVGFVYTVLIAQLFFFACTILISSVRNWITLHVVSRVNYRMVTDYLYKLFQMPLSFFAGKRSGDLLQRVFDHETIDSFLGNNTANTLFAMFNLMVFGLILAYFDTTIFMFFFFGTLAYFLWILLFVRKRKKIDNAVFDNDIRNTDILLELFDNIEDIVINGSQRRRRRIWQRFQRQIFRTNIQRLSIEEYLNNGSRFINESKNIIIMVIGAMAVVRDELSLGTLLAVQYILAQTQGPLRELFDFVLKYQEAQLAYARLREVHATAPKTYRQEIEYISAAPSIRFKNVSFSYDHGSRFRLEGLNLYIPPNKTTAIVGTSGTGKTTILKLLLKYAPPDTGEILIDNISLGALNEDYWRNKVAVVMQEGNVFYDTLLNNLTESDSERPVDNARLLKSLRLSNLGDMVNSLPNGIHTKVGKNGIQLSGGEKQRLLIARAIYKDAPIVILDEATSALDSENERQIIANLKDFLGDRTAITIAHRLSTIRNADNIVVIGPTGVLEQGRHDQLLASKGHYYRLIGNQL